VKYGLKAVVNRFMFSACQTAIRFMHPTKPHCDCDGLTVNA